MPKAALRNLLILTSFATAIVGCGKEEFVGQQYDQSVSAVGHLSVAAKVDVLFVVDNTPSFNFPAAELQGAMPGFVSTLTNQGWNYHVAAIPMALSSSSSSYVYTAPSIGSVLVDPSRNTATTRSGSINEDFVPAPYAITSSGSLQTVFSINQYVGGTEQAFRSIRDALQSERANFVRDDAMLAVVVITNGQDNSGNTPAQWAEYIRVAAGKTDLRSIQVFPIISNRLVSDRSCLGANATYGSRYADLAYAFGTPNPWMFNVCQATSGSMSTMLQALASQLSARKVDFVRTAIALNRAPRVIQWVKKNGVELPRDNDVNGWTYEDLGSPRQVCEVTIPYDELCTNTQFVIRLHGSATALGDDVLDYRADF